MGKILIRPPHSDIVSRNYVKDTEGLFIRIIEKISTLADRLKRKEMIEKAGV